MNRIPSPRLASYASDTKGDIAILTGLAILMFIIFISLSTNINRAYRLQTDMQQAADIGSLAGAITMGLEDPEKPDDAKILELADKYYQANIGEIPGGGTWSAALNEQDVAINRSERTVRLTPKGELPKVFLGGGERMAVAAPATAHSPEPQLPDLEVAIAFDITTSMVVGGSAQRASFDGPILKNQATVAYNTGKLDDAKDAATMLVETLFKAKRSNNTILISVIPFSSAVRLNYPEAPYDRWMNQERLARLNDAGEKEGSKPGQVWNGCIINNRPTSAYPNPDLDDIVPAKLALLPYDFGAPLWQVYQNDVRSVSSRTGRKHHQYAYRWQPDHLVSNPQQQLMNEYTLFVERGVNVAVPPSPGGGGGGVPGPSVPTGPSYTDLGVGGVFEPGGKPESYAVRPNLPPRSEKGISGGDADIDVPVDKNVGAQANSTDLPGTDGSNVGDEFAGGVPGGVPNGFEGRNGGATPGGLPDSGSANANANADPNANGFTNAGGECGGAGFADFGGEITGGPGQATASSSGNGTASSFANTPTTRLRGSSRAYGTGKCENDPGRDGAGPNDQAGKNGNRKNGRPSANRPGAGGAGERPGPTNGLPHTGSNELEEPKAYCLIPPIKPLTDNKNDIVAHLQSFEIDEVNFNSQGNFGIAGTIGQFGMLWAWRTLSPEWKGLWSIDKTPADRPADFGKEVYKAIIYLSDGKGEIPEEYGAYGNKISTIPASNEGESSLYETFLAKALVANKTSRYLDAAWKQFDWTAHGLKAKTYKEADKELDTKLADLCNVIRKEPAISVFTVGFDVLNAGGQEAVDALTGCATTPKHAYIVADAAELQDAFKKIVRDLGQLQIRMVE
jgi:hypothetical protein